MFLTILFSFRRRDSFRVHRGWHVCDPLPPEGCDGEGLFGRRKQSYQGLRQIFSHAQVHDLQLEGLFVGEENKRILSCNLYDGN